MQIIEASDLGVRSAVLTLRRVGSPLTFVVFPMVHVGRPEFYRDVTARLARTDLVVAEGVGRNVIGWALVLTYRVIPWSARRLGLVRQNIDYAALSVPVIRPDSTGAEFSTAWKTIPLRQRLLVLSLIPPFVLASLLGGSRVVLRRFMRLETVDEPSDAMSFEELERVVVDERDEKVVDALTAIVGQHGGDHLTVGVVYGAGHVTGIVHGLHRLGYRVRSADWTTILPL